MLPKGAQIRSAPYFRRAWRRTVQNLLLGKVAGVTRLALAYFWLTTRRFDYFTFTPYLN